jgi:hypothetical protein
LYSIAYINLSYPTERERERERERGFSLAGTVRPFHSRAFWGVSKEENRKKHKHNCKEAEK